MMKNFFSKIEFNTSNGFMNKTVLVLIYLHFMQGLIHNLGHPVTAYMIDDFKIPDFWFGIFFAMMSLGLTIGGLVWGVLGDRGNKRIFMFVGLLIYSLGQFLFAYIPIASWMVLFRLMSGFGVAASVTLLISHSVEHSSKENRGFHLAFMAAAISLGASISYFIGGNLPRIELFSGYRTIFYLQAILNIFHALIMYLVIVDSGSKSEKTTTIIDGFKSIGKLNKTLIVFLISLTFITIGTINVSKFLDVYFETIGKSTEELGLFVLITGLVSLFSSIFIVPIAVKINRDMPIMKWIQIVSAIVVLAIFRTNILMIMLYSVFMLYVVIKTIYIVLEQKFISGYAEEGTYGTIMGVRQAFFAIGMVIGPIIGGFLFDYRPILVFDFSAIMFLLGFFLLVIVSKKLKSEINAINV